MAIIATKLCYLPFAVFSGISYVVALSLYLIAYVLWAISSHFYPDHPRLIGSWSGFSQFREQSKAAAALGTIAAILAFVAFAVPVLIVPSLWFFFMSNLIWSISHYHKLKNPIPFEKGYSTETQKSFLNYTILTTALSLVTAVCLTTAMFVPPLAPILFTISACFGLSLTIAAMGYFLHYHLSEFITKTWNGRNYSQISADLEPDNSQKPGDSQANMNTPASVAKAPIILAATINTQTPIPVQITPSSTAERVGFHQSFVFLSPKEEAVKQEQTINTENTEQQDDKIPLEGYTARSF